MTALIVYGGLAVAILGAFVIGRSLDKQQSNSQATWKTGCIGVKTFFQSVVLGLVGGPIVWLLKGGHEDLPICILGMAAAPFLVDLLRPTVTLHEGQTVPTNAATKLNVANAIAVLIGVVVITAFVVWSLMRV